MGCLAAKSDTTQEQTLQPSTQPEKVFDDDAHVGGSHVNPVPEKKEEVQVVEEAPKTVQVETKEVTQTQEENLNKSGDGTKKKKKGKPDFAVEYIKEINECRTNPANYAAKVENVIQYIKENKEKGGGTFEKEGMPKVALNRGEPAFREFAQKLRGMQPLSPLEAREDLKVPINEDPQKWTDKALISEAVNKQKASIKETSSYKTFNFHFDVGSPQAEISFILQLVDDTPFKGSRQRNIVNPEFKYVGISTLKIKNKNCGYFLFAN